MTPFISDPQSLPPVVRSNTPGSHQAHAVRDWFSAVLAIALTVGGFAAIHMYRPPSPARAGVASFTAPHTVLYTERAREVRPDANGLRSGTASEVVVPRSAIVDIDGRPAVFVEVAEGRFALRAVSVGDAQGPDQSIVSGVTPQEVVVTEGTERLRAELASR
jgi:hypothetical protein